MNSKDIINLSDLYNKIKLLEKENKNLKEINKKLKNNIDGALIDNYSGLDNDIFKEYIDLEFLDDYILQNKNFNFDIFDEYIINQYSEEFLDYLNSNDKINCHKFLSILFKTIYDKNIDLFYNNNYKFFLENLNKQNWELAEDNALDFLNDILPNIGEYIKEYFKDDYEDYLKEKKLNKKKRNNKKKENNKKEKI